jgi:ATP-dependent RNA helicase DDX49/DBP8
LKRDKTTTHESFLFFQDIALNETDFDERRNINKRKKLIREGRDPDMEDEVRQKKKKESLKAFKRQKKLKEKLKAETAN